MSVCLVGEADIERRSENTRLHLPRLKEGPEDSLEGVGTGQLRQWEIPSAGEHRSGLGREFSLLLPPLAKALG